MREILEVRGLEIDRGRLGVRELAKEIGFKVFGERERLDFMCLERKVD